MDTIYEGFLILESLGFVERIAVLVQLGSLRHELCHASVCKQHKFLYEPVGLLGNLLADSHRFSVFVHLHLHLRTLEADGPGCKTLLAELGSQLVECQHCFLHLHRYDLALPHNFGGIALNDFSFFYDGLCPFISKTEIRFDDCTPEPFGNDTCQRSNFKHRRESEFLFIRTQGTELVAELFRQHRHCPVHEIYGCTPCPGLFIHHGTRCDIMAYISNMDSHLIISVFEFAETQGIVKVLGICRVYGKGECAGEIAASLPILFCNLV